MKKFISRRGVAPIIAELLMIIIVTFSFSILAVASQNWIGGQRRENLMEVQERPIIEDVWFRVGPPKSIIISVRNVGEVEFSVNKYTILINRIVDDSQTFPTIEILPGYSGEININYDRWMPDITYEIRISTVRGHEVTTFETP